MKRDFLDAVVSDLVRYRDCWVCQHCGKSFVPPNAGYHCSHFKSRAHKGTRWDLKNLDGLCWGCHKYFGSHLTEYREWKVARIGEQAVTLLEYQARHIFKLSMSEKELLYQQMKAKLNEFKENWQSRLNVLNDPGSGGAIPLASKPAKSF